MTGSTGARSLTPTSGRDTQADVDLGRYATSSSIHARFASLGSSGDTIPNSEKLSMVSPELGGLADGQWLSGPRSRGTMRKWGIFRMALSFRKGLGRKWLQT